MNVHFFAIWQVSIWHVSISSGDNRTWLSCILKMPWLKICRFATSLPQQLILVYLTPGSKTRIKTCRLPENRILSVIPTVTFLVIASDISSGSIYCTYFLNSTLAFYSDILFWHSIWHLFWHPIWHPFWHLFWHFLWHFILISLLASFSCFTSLPPSLPHSLGFFPLSTSLISPCPYSLHFPTLFTSRPRSLSYFFHPPTLLTALFFSLPYSFQFCMLFTLHFPALFTSLLCSGSYSP